MFYCDPVKRILFSDFINNAVRIIQNLTIEFPNLVYGVMKIMFRHFRKPNRREIFLAAFSGPSRIRWRIKIDICYVYLAIAFQT
jgi:hypothetical protein